MNNYERLADIAEQDSLIVKELPLEGNDGRIYGNRIAIRDSLRTTAERACVLAEELGHYYTSTGDILDQSESSHRKQEHVARMWSYDKLINLIGIIDCYKAGCRNRYEAAEYLNVPEECFQDTIDAYRRKYGQFVQVADYVIYFEPCLAVVEMM